jgi:hypothetical protein
VYVGGQDINQDISGLSSRTEEVSHSGRRRLKSKQDGEAYQPGLITGAVTSLEKVAQGGRGFQTSTLDVTMNTGNVDEEMRRQSMGAAAGGASYGSQSSHAHGEGSNHSSSSSYKTSKTYVSGGQGGSSWSSSSGGSQGGSHHQQGGNQVDQQYDYDDEIYYDDDEPEAAQGGNQGSQSHSSYKTSYTYKGAVDPNVAFKHYPRSKRNIIQVDPELRNALQCTATKCQVIRCIAGPLEGNNGALIALRTRLVAETLNKVRFKI